jgi:D-glycero-alpha-D-manno-heptose-7-phosphate kinase
MVPGVVSIMSVAGVSGSANDRLPDTTGCRAVIQASAPMRICDIGGWTDTWFGGPGRVLNIAVTPGVEVSIRPTEGPASVLLDVESFGDRYVVVPGGSRVPRHPLLEAAIDVSPPPPGHHVVISVRSAVPPGCGTGTSAAIAVALLGALAVSRSVHPSRQAIAYAAHQLEAGALGRESGVQDQLCSAFGGINYLEIEAYPEAIVYPMPVWEELSSRLTLVFLGRAHDSSAVHRRVIEDVERHGSGKFSGLRNAAAAARRAVLARDLAEFGQAMIANTEAQKTVHPELVGADAVRVIEVAAAQGAVGWKVNGAGGDGGSITILSPTLETKMAFARQLDLLQRRYEVLPVEISQAGLQVRGVL